MRRHLAPMCRTPMFKQVDALPGSQHHAPGVHRDRKLGLGQYGTNVRRHVIRAFQRMAVNRVIFRHESGKETRQIALNIRVGVFLHDQTGRGMPHKQGQQAILYAARRQPAGYFRGEVVQALAAGGNFEGVVQLSHAGILSRRIIAPMKSLQLLLTLPAPLEQILATARQAAPSLIKLLQRGQAATHEASLAGTLCQAFGIKPQQDWPLAPICADAEGLSTNDNGYWLRLDPVHLEVVMGGLLLRPPGSLQLSLPEAHALIADINLHWREAGLEIQALGSTRWYLHLPAAPNLRTTPLDQMDGEYLTPHLPRGADARYYLKLINEVQMLMHAHPVNLARENEGRPAVNGLWLWGGGNLADSIVERNAKTTLDLVAGNDFELRALARHAGCAFSAPPKKLSEMHATGRALVALTPFDGSMYGDIAAHLAQLEQDWFHPLLQQLTWGRIRQVRLDLIGQQAVTLTPGQVWRFWQKNTLSAVPSPDTSAPR